MWPHFQLNISTLTEAVSVLTAMITPALLLSACGTLILSTSNRLARIVDRIRSLAVHVEELADPKRDVELREERMHHGREEMKMQSKRLRIIQRALTLLYLAAVCFLFTSVALGGVYALRSAWYVLPVVLGVGGACCMLTAAIMLLFEARKAVDDLAAETDFHRYVTRHYIDKKELTDPNQPVVPAR
jgi:hypothetical protein